MECVYKYNNKLYKTVDDLRNAFESKDWDKVVSIMFKLDKDKQLEVYDTLTELKQESKFIPYSLNSSSYSAIHGDPDILVNSEEYFTTLTFIDSGYFEIDGKAPIFRLDTRELLALEKQYMLSLGMSELAADERCELMQKNDERIAKDAYDLHKIIASSRSDDSDRQFSGRALNTSFSGIYDLLGPLVRQMRKDMNISRAGSMFIKNVNLEAQLKGLTKKIMGHVDNILVREDGSIEIFNIKVSTQNESEWSPAKKEKFRVLLALLKRILEFNGIDSRKIKVHIIPVKLEYDDSFLNVIKVSSGLPISYDLKDYTYIFKKYDNIAALFIESNASIEDIDDLALLSVNQKLQLMFPESNIDIYATGILESVKGWLKSHWKSIAKHASGKPGWEIKLPNKEESIYIADTRVAELNEELVNILEDMQDEILSNDSKAIGVQRLISDIQHSYSHEYAFFLGKASGFMRQLLSKYFELSPNKQYKWELIKGLETLNRAGIILFRNKVTDQLDVFTVSAFDPSSTIKFNHRENLMGSYIPDLNNYNYTLKATYGNIEAMRTLLVVNEILPSLEFKYKLGLLKTISLNTFSTKPGQEFEISSLLPHYNTAVTIVNQNNQNQKVKLTNNFKDLNADIIDPALVFILTWREAISSDSKVNLLELKGLDQEISQRVLTDGTVIEGLETLDSVEAKIGKLTVILDRLTRLAEERGISLDPKQLINSSNSSDGEISAISKLYIAATKALNMYHGDLSIENEEFSQAREYFSKPQSIPNSNVRTVGYMFLRSVNKIAGDVLLRYSPIREIIQLYYKDCGYTNFLNSVIGNLASLYDSLYEKVNGENTMKLKNPYDMSNDLKSYERKFLKDILWELNKIRAEMIGLSWKFTGKEDPELIKKINDGSISYLNVPLKMASKATQRANLTNFSESGKRWWRRFTHPTEAFREFSEEIFSEDDYNKRERDISLLQAYNPYRNLESENTRINYMNKMGVNYFETNLEDIVIDFLEKHVLTTEYSKMLVRTRGILLDLHLRGEAGDNPKAVEHTVKTINDFLSVAVYNKSIMEESSLKIESVLQPLREAVSKCYIAANPTAALRDTMLGLFENTIRALTKFLTDIDVKDVAYGYKEVITEGPTSPTTIAKLNQLNIKYRFSNLDVARISEGLKTGRTGILNADNWLYSTLRGPDYLNRMVLFSARMHHDGVEDAYYIDNGELVYDYKKDKRFSAYTSNDTRDLKKYNALKALYLSLLRAFNLENGTSLKEGDPLPDAYTLLQIESFKTFADNIYGSYNKSTRAKYEQTAIGRNFAVFSTWMNGIVDVYWKERQISYGESKWLLETTSTGELLYFDKNGNILTLAEGGDPNLPVYKDVPVMVLGIFQTLGDAFKELYFGGWNNFKDVIWDNDIHRRNFNRLFTDLLVAGIQGAIFQLVLNPAYADHKKLSNGKNLITNALIELTYRASSSCFDGFKGPFAVLTYFGESTNPATYSLGSKVLTDLYGFLFGEKTMMDLAMGSVALPRSFRDTYKMWLRDQN